MYARTYVLRCCLFLLETPFCAHLPRESHPSHSTSKLLYHTVQSVVYVRILLYCTYFFAIKEPKEQENGVKSYSQNTFRYANILSLEEYVILLVIVRTCTTYGTFTQFHRPASRIIAYVLTETMIFLSIHSLALLAG